MGEPVASRGDVARLLGRVAFGATSADLDRWAGRPYAELVDSLVDVPDIATRPVPTDEAKRMALEKSIVVAALSDTQRWWLERMRTTAYPLEERMTLFWHDHFATAMGAESGPFAPELLVQNQTIRQNALGNFRTLVYELTIDPAMLWWLNGAQSRKGNPNENYARELFELFTLGVTPQVYTETDIREAARALTGWRVDSLQQQGVFRAADHDTGTKTILGRTIQNAGAEEYKRVVDVALDQPVCARFVAWKLVQHFGYQPAATDLLVAPDPLVARVAAVLQSGWDIRAAVRVMLLDDDFRHAAASAGRQTVRTPVDVVVHASKALNLPLDGTGTINVLDLLRRMGQVPFDPPNVGGWPAGRDWLSPTTMIARYDWGIRCYQTWAAQSALTRVALPPSADASQWTALLGLADLSATTRDVLAQYVASRPVASEAERQTGVLALLVASPDWMVM